MLKGVLHMVQKQTVWLRNKCTMLNGGGGEWELKYLPVSERGHIDKTDIRNWVKKWAKDRKGESQKCTPKSLAKVEKDAQSHGQSEKYK